MKREIIDIIKQMKENEGHNYYGVNYYRGKFYITSIGVIKKNNTKRSNRNY